MARTREVAGLTLVSQGPGVWHTADGRFELRADRTLSVCGAPHPTRTGYCYGSQQHYSAPEWMAWDLGRGDWVQAFDPESTMTATAQNLARYLARKGN